MDQTHTGVAGALAGTQKWVRLVSVLGFIGSGFMILAGLGMAAGGMALPGTPVEARGGLAVLGFLYICMALLYLVPSLYLWRYGTGIQDYLRDPQSIQLERALDAQRKFWKFVGVLAVIGMVFMVAGMVMAILIPLAVRGGMGS